MAKTLPPPIELPAATRRAIAKLATELGLTGKQFAFSSLVVSGLSQSEAYRRVYDVNPDGGTLVSAAASNLAKNDRVSTVIAEGRASLNHVRSLTERGRLAREKLEEKLEALLESADPQVTLKAAKLYGELFHIQAFAKRRESDDASDAMNALDELAQMTENTEGYLNKRGKVIDIQATQSGQNVQVIENKRSTLDVPGYAVAWLMSLGERPPRA